ncbi:MULTISPECIES: MFS transporter [unclassified Sphingomonas]|uniref:MFS transporter n=1 Tax=unclassified Sphingomonas TaxID=196159 RepID=UPI00092BB2A3|nr:MULTISPECIES: MFS transporter [unclassified Sphingomonas]MBN8847263.1 MFS transporter [Sphingomonas sp.]MBS0284362.1 MFS transporter [Pseudomonadota bacterium]OJV33961.1 MAG: MFS transporter [Sphingomonas sp. 67-36]
MSDGLPIPRRYAAIAAMSFGSALVVIDGGVANVALPTIAHDLHVAQSSVVSIVTIYQVMLVMLMLPIAGLGERIGLKRTYQGGQLIFTIATLLCFFAKSLPFLLIVRAVQAMGAAAVLSVASALIRQIYPSSHLGRGLAINSVVVTSSAAAAPTIGGLVLAVAPWPWVFASAIPFAIVSLALGRSIPDPKPRHTSFDVTGAVMCAAMFGLVIGGLESGVHGDSPVVSAAITLAGFAVGYYFIRREQHESHPILPIDLLARPVIGLSAIGGFVAFTASMTLLISTPFRLQALGFSAATIGAAIAPWPMTNMIVAPLAGYLSDRIPAGILGGIGMAVSIVALTLIAFMPAHPTYFDIAWRMALCGSGFGLYLPPNARLIIGSAPRERSAAAGSLVSTVRLSGQTTGATLVAALLAMEIGAGRVPPLISATLALVAGLCSVARLRPSIRNPSLAETRAEIPTLRQTRY